MSWQRVQQYCRLLTTLQLLLLLRLMLVQLLLQRGTLHSHLRNLQLRVTFTPLLVACSSVTVSRVSCGQRQLQLYCAGMLDGVGLVRAHVYCISHCTAAVTVVVC
jgi:hypothetical protein